MATYLHQYPTLSLIDHIAGMPPTRLADDPAAPRLELRARKLLAEYWSDAAWLTGLVSDVALCIVREILAYERIALGDVDISAPLADIPIPGPVPVNNVAALTAEIKVGVAP